MNEIKGYILKKYGLLLSDVELQEYIDWLELNHSACQSEADIDKITKNYLYSKYEGRELHLYEEDTSNMLYLLQLLKSKGKK